MYTPAAEAELVRLRSEIEQVASEANGLRDFYQGTQRDDSTIEGVRIASDYKMFFARTLDVFDRLAALARGGKS